MPAYLHHDRYRKLNGKLAEILSPARNRATSDQHQRKSDFATRIYNRNNF